MNLIGFGVQDANLDLSVSEVQDVVLRTQVVRQVETEITAPVGEMDMLFP